MGKLVNLKYKLSQTQLIALGYIALILTGMLLLLLPVSTRPGNVTTAADALFTSTSATCVTGLVVYDTYTHWSTFGQCVILSLIQVGGLGFMTTMTLVAIFFRRKVGLQDRMMLMQSAGMLNLAGAVRLLRQIAFCTFGCELVGAILLSTRFIPRFGWAKGIYFSVFHAISAFCNAGFDLMGIRSPGSSLTTFVSDPVVNLTIMGLIVAGGLGFLVWSDLWGTRLHPKRFQLHTRIVLSTTFILILGGALLFFIFEQHYTLAGLSLKDQILASLFQSVTPRTAGFNTVDMGALSESGSTLTMMLMFIGGSPGSTAGGIKTTTLAVFILGTVSSIRRNHDTEVFRYRIDDSLVHQTSSIISIYFSLVLISTMLLCTIEPYGMEQIAFEVISAIGTVGLTTGITSSLCTFSRMVLCLMMFAGRMGGLTFMLILARKKAQAPLTRPAGRILIG